MAMLLEVKAHFDAEPDALFHSALRFSEMTEAMHGIATYAGLPANGTAAQGDVIIVDVTFWGLFKQKGHRIFIEKIDLEKRIIQSRESGNGILRWDHNLSIQPDGTLACWTDTVIIDAGWRTLFVSWFAAFVYMRRHRRRKALSLSYRISSGKEP